MKNNGIDVVVIAYIVSQFKLIIDIINKYYNAEIQKAAFALPNFVKNYLPTK